MSGRNALKDAIGHHARRVTERAQRVRRATVTAAAPLTVELFDSDLVLTEDDDFWLGQWATFYQHAVGIETGDVVLMHMEEDWVLFDIVSDKDVTGIGGSGGGSGGD